MKLLTIVQSHILAEGRVEDVLKKYEGELSKANIDPNELVELFSSHDPSRNNKYLDWMVKSLLVVLSGEYKNPTTFSNEDFIIYLVESFHKNITRISSEFAKQKGFPKKVVDNPKDINSYNVRDMKIMSGILNKLSDSKQNLSDAYILYENDRWLIISPKNYDASCKYGAGTKWCVSSKKTTSHYRDYTQIGKLVFVIDKKDKDYSPGLPYNENPMYKIAVYYKPASRNLTIWNAPDVQIGTDLQHFFAPNIQQIIMDFMITPTSKLQWKDNKQKIDDYFSTNPNIYDWVGYPKADDNFPYLLPSRDYLDYHLRIYPYGTDNKDPKDILIVQLWTSGSNLSSSNNIKTWKSTLNFDSQDPVNEVRQEIENIIAGPIDYEIQYHEIINSITNKTFAGGWRFKATYVDDEDATEMGFDATNKKLSSYYWDKYKIGLDIVLSDEYAVNLICQYRPDSGKMIQKQYKMEFNNITMDTIRGDILSMTNKINTNLMNFIKQTENK